MKLSVHHLSLLLILISCEDPLQSNNENPPQSIIETSMGLFDGSLIEQSSMNIDGQDVWKVSLQNNAGSVVSFYWRKSFSNLHKMVGENGPFDYEIVPAQNAINFSTARFLVINNTTVESFDSWEFTRLENDPNKWLYIFYSMELEKPLKIDATTGSSL